MAGDGSVRFRDFIGMASVCFGLFGLMCVGTGAVTGGAAFLVAAFVMTPFVMSKLAAGMNRQKTPFIARFGIGFILFFVSAALGAAGDRRMEMPDGSAKQVRVTESPRSRTSTDTPKPVPTPKPATPKPLPTKTKAEIAEDTEIAKEEAKDTRTPPPAAPSQKLILGTALL